MASSAMATVDQMLDRSLEVLDVEPTTRGVGGPGVV